MCTSIELPGGQYKVQRVRRLFYNIQHSFPRATRNMSRCVVFHLVAVVAVSLTVNPHVVNALTCATCPPTIVIGGAPFTHAGGHESSGNIVQCE